MKVHRIKFITGLVFLLGTWSFVFLIKFIDRVSNWYFSAFNDTFNNLSYLNTYFLNCSLVLFLGVIVPFWFFSQIKCKKCGYKFLLDIYNRKPGPEGLHEIFSLKNCPKCNAEINEE